MPPAGSGGCVPVGSASGIAAFAMLVIGPHSLIGALGVALARYRRGERDIRSLVARPIQTLICAGDTRLVGVALLALVPPRALRLDRTCACRG